LCWDMREIVAQLRDAAVLIQLAGEGLESARIIAQWLNGDREGFWPVLFQLHKLFPTDQDLHEKLAASIERSESGFAGRLSDRNSGIIQEIEAKLKDPSTPVTALGWLREIAERLSVQIGKVIIWEYNLDIDDLRGIIGNRNSPQRLWAIGRILRFARFEDILRLLTVEDIADALDQIDLPDERRRILEQAVPIWRHGN
jgi:hypothetical protein